MFDRKIDVLSKVCPTPEKIEALPVVISSTPEAQVCGTALSAAFIAQ
jgi:hypothetical protein